MSQETQQDLPALSLLRQHPQWVCWRREQRGEKSTKIPYDPRTGRCAESNNPATWASYELAQESYQRSQTGASPYDGVGYMFHGDITGIDLDHCISQDGSIDPWAQAYLNRLNSYAERSPSGTGIHILVLGTIPKGLRRGIGGLAQPGAAIEMYCQGRYFTITGQHIEGTPTTIHARQEALESLYAEVNQHRAAGPATKQSVLSRNEGNVGQDDELLLQKAMVASNGGKFRSLFYHGAAGYPSASEADMALCMLLAFWTGRDLARMDRLFRRSALYREKWDTARAESTYGAETIHRAAARCQVTYSPDRNREQLEQDIEQLLTQIAHQQARTGASKKAHKPYQIQPKEVPISKVWDYLEMNEYGDALFFATVFAGQVCYDHTNKEWYLWGGHAWKQDSTGKVRQLVAGVLGSLYLKAAAELNTTHAELGIRIQGLTSQGSKETDSELGTLKDQYKRMAVQMGELQTRAKALRSAKRNANVLTFVQSILGITAEMWDTHVWLLATPNGVIDLRTGAWRDGEPDDYIRTVAPTEWSGLETPCPRFEQFLEEIFADKADRQALILFLQRLLGYGITGLTTLHHFPILYGEEGRNGKDTLLATLKAVLGPLVGAVSNDVFIAQDRKRTGGAATPHLCDLQGKRLAWGSETKEGDRLDIAQIKLLTGGGEISTRQLHGHQYSFTPTHKLLLMTNYKPHAEARDKAFWTRACLIEFGLRFVAEPRQANERKADPSLKDALQQERSGILAWLVRGCLDWQQRGLEIPASVQLATDKYREEEDKLLQFIQECCVVAPHTYCKASVLFAAYRSWCEENQFGRGMNGKLFGDEISKRFQKKHSKSGRIYQGIGLLIQESDQETLFDEERKGEGSVKEAPQPFTVDKASSEASAAHTVSARGEGCEGLQQLFPKNEKDNPSIEEKHGNMLHTLHQPTSSVTPQPASEANGEAAKARNGPFTDPSPEISTTPCTTRHEKRLQVAHEAIASQFSAGYGWCERCTPQREWMEYGEQMNYPLVIVPDDKPFQVRAGKEKWLLFAQDAGYEMVEKAVVALRSRSSANGEESSAMEEFIL